MTDGITIRASGGVLSRRSGTTVEIAIVHRPKYDDWSMPKGKLHSGEASLAAACREVVEETGVRPVVGRRLPQQEYWLGPDRKVVDYWEMTPADGRTGRGNPGLDSMARAAEVDVVRWLRAAEAATWLSYDRDRELLRRFLSLPRADETVLVVRHGSAGDRSNWPGDDRLRPLDEQGWVQAHALRAAACFGPRRVFAADRVRCVQTVAPLADDLGVPVETEPALSESAYLVKPERALRRIREIAQSRVPAVVCSQREVIPDLLKRLAAEDGLVLGRVTARKGSVWALSFMDGRLVGADYYPDLTGGG
jgi:8-oxo-dGTP diphosphatase